MSCSSVQPIAFYKKLMLNLHVVAIVTDIVLLEESWAGLFILTNVCGVFIFIV